MASTSKSVLQFSRCCDPLKIHSGKPKTKDLRHPSAALLKRKSFLLKATDLLCATCRRAVYASEDDTVAESHTANEDPTLLVSQETTSEYMQDTVDSTSQTTTSSSQESAPDETCVLSRINDALQILEQSPIPLKKAKIGSFVSTKIDRACVNLKERLGCHKEIPGTDQMALAQIIDGLKQKYQDVNTTRSDKIQVLTVLPDSWTNAKISSEFGASLYMIRAARALKSEKGALATPDPKVGPALPESTIVEIIKFYEDDEVSVNMPGMKDFVSIRGLAEKRIHRQKRLLLANLKELYEHFKSIKPELSVGFSKFASLRPKYCVSAGASGTHTSCVCIKHQNLKLLLIGCNIERLTEDSGHLIKDYHDCLRMIICSEPNAKCYFHNCDACPGIEPLHEIFEKTFDDHEIDSITYKQWIAKPRMTLETIVKTSNNFIDEVCDDSKSLLEHAFIAKNQAQYFKHVENNLENDEFLVVSDFAENYAFIVQQAVAGFHWNNNQATIYPVVIYFRHNGSITHKSLMIISDCLHHDAIAVHVFNKIINDFIKTICKRPLRVIYISNGAPSQFKNFKNFGNLYFHEEDFAVPAEWHYFASAHGKGPCDGVGGTVKRLAARASLQLPLDRQILTPWNLYQWASQPTNVPAITVRYSTVVDYNADGEIMDKRFTNFKAIPQTQKQHCVIPGPDSTLICKRYSFATEFTTHRILKK